MRPVAAGRWGENLNRSWIILRVGIALCVPATAEAAGKKTPATPSDGKRVVSLAPVEEAQIEMPDASLHDFGKDFQAGLTTKLTESGRYIVADPSQDDEVAQPLGSANDPYVWPGTWVASGGVVVKVHAMSFETGLRGEHMFYGFDERLRNDFNDGSGKLKNEFPLRDGPEAVNWFGNRFDEKGIIPFDSHSGLNLGDGFAIDAVMAWLKVKYAFYHSELHLEVQLRKYRNETPEIHRVYVKGDGFFFDFAGAYEKYSGGLAFARRDAMDQAFQKSMAEAYTVIEKWLIPLPLMARIDRVGSDGKIFLGTGPNAGVVSGVRYFSVDRPELVIQVDQSYESGAVAHLAQGDKRDLRAGMVFQAGVPQAVSAQANSALATPAESSEGRGGQAATPSDSSDPADPEVVQMPFTILKQPKIAGYDPIQDRKEAVGQSYIEEVTLPYRIYRYFMYDREHEKKPDLPGLVPIQVGKGSWVQQIGLDRAPAMSGVSPIVAMIDSGVDYNHPFLHGSLWRNLTAQPDPRGAVDSYGWDFVSGDARPADDGYHGTELASLVVAVAPTVKLMPLKVFNPWGITNSASLYGAFQYAVDHGAKIILCGWDTPVDSQAIERGLAYAQDHDVVVIAAAGDRGKRISIDSVYPAGWFRQFPGLFVVTAVDSSDRLVTVPEKAANYDPEGVSIAAPGQDLFVADPRSGQDTVTSTDLAAALVAGAVARIGAASVGAQPSEWLNQLKADAVRVPGLNGAVKDGLRLRIAR